MELSDFYEHGIARGVVRYANTKPDWCLYGYGWMFRSLTDLDLWKGDGIISRIESSMAADKLASLSLPLVDVAGAYKRPGFRSVTNDDVLTGSKAATHLKSCGFSRFAFLGVSGTIWSEQRKLGFEEGLRGYQHSGKNRQLQNQELAPMHIPSFERPLAWWEGYHEEDGELAAFLSGLQAPSALFACNDTSGLRATELARRLKIAVPESLAILGVDNEDILCELASPSLSSIMLDCESIGFRAAMALDEILDGPGQESTKESRLVIPPKDVIERETTRIYACQDQLVSKAATFIKTRACDGITVPDVLAVVSASRRALETRFRAAMGRSLHEEILRVRLVKAKQLLRVTDLTIQEIALESGFKVLQRFHASFKAVENMTPGEWRREAQRSSWLNGK
jgi:LacI family transcriptional regulator